MTHIKQNPDALASGFSILESLSRRLSKLEKLKSQKLRQQLGILFAVAGLFWITLVIQYDPPSHSKAQKLF